MLNLFVRAISTITIGILLLIFREQAMPFIVMCVGALFILPSLFILALTFVPSLKRFGAVSSNVNIISFVAFGSLLLGLWMFLSPSFFVAILMLVLGGVLMLMGLMQIISLLRSKLRVSSLMYVMPLLILGAGLTTLLYPFETASIPFVILGIAAILGAVSDIVNTILLKFLRREGNSSSEIQITEIK